jgi:hypothetical protein
MENEEGNRDGEQDDHCGIEHRVDRGRWSAPVVEDQHA